MVRVKVDPEIDWAAISGTFVSKVYEQSFEHTPTKSLTETITFGWEVAANIKF